MLTTAATTDEVQTLVEELNFSEKVSRSLMMIGNAFDNHGKGLVVANSLGKDSMVIWHLAKRISPEIRGFIITTRFKPIETIRFMKHLVADYPELKVYKSEYPIEEHLYSTSPDRCCHFLKVLPTKLALKEMKATCWVTGLRCTEGRTREDYREIEYRDKGLEKLNPILLWSEREVWQYLAIHKVDVNSLYAKGYRSLGCAPCTSITNSSDERSGRWVGTSKCGGECGIHTQPLME